MPFFRGAKSPHPNTTNHSVANHEIDVVVFAIDDSTGSAMLCSHNQSLHLWVPTHTTSMHAVAAQTSMMPAPDTDAMRKIAPTKIAYIFVFISFHLLRHCAMYT